MLVSRIELQFFLNAEYMENHEHYTLVAFEPNLPLWELGQGAFEADFLICVRRMMVPTL